MIQQFMAQATEEEHRALLDAVMTGQLTSMFDIEQPRAEPTLLAPPTQPRGFRVRLDLRDTSPPVWRRLELPGDLTLDRLHDVIQAAMGWTNSHLHRFRTGRDYSSPYFVTTVDLDEGEDGLLEDGIRLDQLVADKDDEVWYEYDFGDSWDHRLRVEAVLDDPPPTARCTAGRLACPPEDCGGIGGYEALAAWVRGGRTDALLPAVFDTAEHALAWLPLDWDPDAFDIEETNAAVADSVAAPVAVTGELADLAAQFDRSGIRVLRHLLARPASHGPTDVTDEQAARLTEPYRILLDVIGDGVTLTAAGYLPPALVREIAVRTGITSWWIGTANREDLTPPVAELRDTARALGLITLRKSRLTPTAAGKRAAHDPQALLRHIIGRLPLSKVEAERQGGWFALAVVGAGVPYPQWESEVSDLFLLAGWRDGDGISRPHGRTPTFDVLEQLAGRVRHGWNLAGDADPAVAAVARAVIRRG